ncbi:MAG: PD40 domain-containing protein [Candidatus Marinimicrobia bacterium]|nr:PD40 domain-containing protein [Candidatus Neomarinimicrobiota bacterium]
MKKLLLIFLFMKFLMAQDPSDIHWKQIQSDQYTLIFPEEISQHAIRIANRLEYISPKIGFYLQDEHQPLSLILSNRSVWSNGYVTMFPYKSEWYSLPYTGKSIFIGDWHNMLSLHETRHVHQYTYLNHGLIKFSGFLFGDYGRGIAMNIMIPDWYKEGDAVLTETLWSYSGRGRIANFQQCYRTILLTEPNLKYETARFGSYKRPTPDDYELGYFMTAFLARKYGYEAWSGILKSATWLSFKNPISPMSAAIEKYTDYEGTKKLFYSMQVELKEIWFKQDEGIKSDSLFHYRSAKDKHFTDHVLPYKDQKGILYYLKSSNAFGTAVYCENKKIINVPHYVATYGLDIRNEKIIWSQYREDKRWDKQSWLDIAIFNIKNRELKILTKNRRYFCPSISSDGTKIAAVEFTDTRQCNIVIIEANSGELIQKIHSPDNEMVHYPTWSSDDQQLVFTSTGYKGRAINELNLDNHIFTQLTNYTHEDLFRPKYWNNYIIFESGFSGLDNIYALDRNTKQIYQVTSRQYGAAYPTIYKDRLLFSDYTPKGYKISEMLLTEMNFIPIHQISLTRTDYFQPLLTDEFQPIEEKDIPQKQHKITDYKGLGSMCNPHSYSPLITPFFYGGILRSDNLLETHSQTLYFLKAIDDEEYIGGFHFDYLGIYPKISTRMTFANRTESNIENDPFIIKDSWKELEFSLNTEWPLFRTDKGVQTSISNANIGAGYKYIFNREVLWDPASSYFHNFDDQFTVPLYFSINGLTIRQKSLQALVPTYSQLTIYSNHTVGNASMEGTQSGWQFKQGIDLGYAFGMTLDVMYEYNKDKGYSFKRQFEPMPVFDDFDSNTQTKLLFILKRHLWFPDIDFFWLVYVKRFSMSLLYESYGNFFCSNIDNQCALGIGLTTEIGGIATIRTNFPVTLFYYINIESKEKGVRFSLEI